MISRSLKPAIIPSVFLVLLLGTMCEKSPVEPTAGPVVITHLGPSETVESSERFIAVNESENVLWYLGYEETYPIYTRQVESDTGWVDDLVGWCGFGLISYEFKPEMSFEFEAHPPTEEGYVWRVGIRFYFDQEELQDSEIYWSESVEL